MSDDDLQERAAVDGRVAFAIAAFAALAGLVAILDRVGVPERIIAASGPVVALLGLTLIGVSVRSMRISRFYAGGRAIPAVYAGLAAAAIAIALASPFTPPVADHFSGAGVFAGFAGGLTCAVLISGPYLRKSGAFSISDLIGSRFQNPALSLGVAVIAAASALLAALAGYEVALSGLTTIAGLSRPASAALVGFVLVLLAAPGGLSGVVWGAAAAAGVFIAAFVLPLAVLLLRGQTLALPVLGDADAWTAAMTRISIWQGEVGQDASLTLSLGMALGLASCAPLLAPMTAVRDRAAAVRAGLGALTWGAVLAALIAATVAASTLGLLDAMVGRRPERLPDSIYAAGATRLVATCKAAVATPAQARTACQGAPNFNGVLRAEDIETRGLFLMTALPPLAAEGAALAGLVWAAVIAAGLVLAASGLLAAASALGNDAFHRVRDRAALTSRRLAITRAILVGSVAFAAALAGAVELDPRILIGFALALSAAGLAPLMALALWPRARGVDAILALVSGVVVAEATLARGDISVQRLALAAVAGCVVALAVGVVASLFGGGERSHGRAFLAGLLRGDGDVLKPDKGA